MARSLDEITRDALELTQRQRLALAHFLLEADQGSADTEVEAAWEDEIVARIKALDEGRARIVSYEEATQELSRRLSKQ